MGVRIARLFRHERDDVTALEAAKDLVNQARRMAHYTHDVSGANRTVDSHTRTNREAPGPLAQVRTRRAGDPDAQVISDLLSDSFAEYRHLYTAQAFAGTAITPDAVRERLREGPTWIATLENVSVGTVSALKRSKELYVRSMAVAPTARGCGIGNHLLKEVEHFARISGCRRLVLSTTPFLTRAIRLYERYGFARAAGGPSEMFGTPLFTMALDLSRIEGLESQTP
jgi:ribosomal protein S18 acetylase RimI-like enzyme